MTLNGRSSLEWPTLAPTVSGIHLRLSAYVSRCHVRGDILYTLTEIYRFAVGLAQGGILDPAALLSIQLHNTRDYMLFESFSRFFPHRYVNQSDRPIEQQQSLPVGELSAVADQMALEMAIKIYSVFGWIPC